MELRPGKQTGSNCARLSCRHSDWTVARADDHHERRSDRRAVQTRDCARGVGFRDGRGRVDVEVERSWVEVGRGYVAAGHSRSSVRVGARREKSSVERIFAFIR
jgi:hypothetical protein